MFTYIWSSDLQEGATVHVHTNTHTHAPTLAMGGLRAPNLSAPGNQPYHCPTIGVPCATVCIYPLAELNMGI